MQNIILNAGLFMLFILIGSALSGLFIVGGTLMLIGLILFTAIHFIMKGWDMFLDYITRSE